MDLAFDNNSSTPLYVQLADAIREEIQTGKLHAGDKIMPELELKKKYNVARITIQHALNLLVEEKLLFRKQGKGTFVAYPVHDHDAILRDRSFTVALFHSHSIPNTEIVLKSRRKVDKELRDRFDMREFKGDVFGYLERLRWVDGKPAVYEIDYLPEKYSFLVDIYDKDQSLLVLIRERLGILPIKYYDNFMIVEATPSIAAKLNIDFGHPLLSVAETVMDENGNIIFYNEQLINTKRYVYKFNYSI